MSPLSSLSISAAGDLWSDIEPSSARKLVVAAVEAFSELGFHATTTRSIAMRAGMSPAGMYVHFRSKSDLLFAIARAGHESSYRTVCAAIENRSTPAARVAAFASSFSAWHARHHTVAKVVQYELAALDPVQFRAIAELRTAFEELLRREIERGVQEGSFSVDSPAVATTAILSLGIDVARWYRDSTPITPDTLGAEYAALVLRMLDRHSLG